MKAKVKHTALLHNGKRYEVGDDIELTEQEAQSLAYYLELPIGDKAEKSNVETTEVEDTEKADEAAKVQAEATAIADELDAKEAEKAPKETATVEDATKADETAKVQAEATAIADKLDAKEAEATEKATKGKVKK